MSTIPPPIVNQQIPAKKKMSKGLLIVLIILGGLFVLCVLIGIFSPKSATTTPQPTAIVASTPGPTISTLTPIPTVNPTIIPTEMPSSTPLPQPVIMEGKGTKVVDFNPGWDGPSILTINNKGSSNFSVVSYDAQGNEIDLLVNTIGSYNGVLLIGAMDDEAVTTRFQVTSSGSWTISVSPFSVSSLPQLNVPGHFDGNGDSIIALVGSPDLLTTTCNESNNIAVWAYTDTMRDLIVNEIGPYSGQNILPNNTFMLVVQSEGKWSIDITSK